VEQPPGNGGTAEPHRHVSASAREVAERASVLTRLELELAQLELKRKANELAVGSALAASAAVLAAYAVAFLLAALATGIATALPWWAALLIVAGGLLLVVAVCLLVARGLFKKGSPPVPQEAIRQAQLTREAISR
jgi:Putative Actinobacterial Holin-X, holin superfamily III